MASNRIPDTTEAVFNDQKEMQESYKKHGNAGLKSYISSRLSTWKSTKVKIAVTGVSGAGKSSLINCLRGVKAKDKGAAQVGTTETTKTVKAYPYPHNENIVLYDIPGVGTDLFPKETYFQTMKLSQFDLFIIVSANRFRKEDGWLGREITETLKRKRFFVRAKFDQDVDSSSSDYGESEEVAYNKILDDCIKYLGSDARPDIFFISTRLQLRHKYDFGRLCSELLCVDDQMNEALAFSLSATSAEIVKAKKTELQKRISKVAIGSAVAGFLPVPGLETLADSGTLLGEIKLYMEQFEVDDISLEATAYELNMSLHEIKKDLETPYMDISLSGLNQFYDKNDTSDTFDKIKKYILPGIGSIMSARSSYIGCEKCLNKLLDKAANDAVKITEKRMRYFAKNM